MKTIHAKVNTRLLSKADRLFTGSLSGRIIEVLQNARRAGATRVDVTNHDGLVTVHDNGSGIEDFRGLLDLGGSGWPQPTGNDLEASEDPAGVGLFSLAPRKLVIRSRGRRVEIKGDGWTSAPVAVSEDDATCDGTSLTFPDEPWTKEAIERHAVFSGMTVTVDNEACAKEPFIHGKSLHDRDLGSRIQVVPFKDMTQWQRDASRVGCVGESNVVVNFHGQTVGFNYRPIGENDLYYLVDLTGEPTSIRLMLPARTQVVENEAYEQLKQLIEREAFRYVQQRGRHQLPYEQYVRGRELGVELPKAEPVYRVGLLTDDGYGVEPVEVVMPEGFDLSRCYRLDPSCAGDETDEANAHLLAALGEFEKPFVPVDIHASYDGYTWTNLPTIQQIKVRPGKELQRSWLWTGELICLDTLTVEARTSDGEVFASRVCMALVPPQQTTEQHHYHDDEVYVTPDVQHRLRDMEVWRHLGGFTDDGDTWDTQEFEFGRQLEAFWARLEGPDEPLRRKLLAEAQGLGENWQSVTIHSDGRIVINNQDGETRTVAPPQT